MDRNKCRMIADALRIGTSIQDIEKKLCVKMSIDGGGSFLPGCSVTFKIKFSEASEGVDGAKAEFERLAPSFGIPKDAYGKIIKISLTEYKVTGIRSSARTKCVIITRVHDNKIFITTAEDINRRLTEGQPKRPIDAVMSDLLDIECQLSPENLSCDGEASRAQVQTRRSELMRKRGALERELGRTVTSDEVWKWGDKETGGALGPK